MTRPEYRTQVKRWFVEIGVCDGGGVGHWVETTESVEVTGEAEANALRDDWLASGKLREMPWGELRPQNPYGLFRVRQAWEDLPAPTDAAQAREAKTLDELSDEQIHAAINAIQRETKTSREAAILEAANVCKVFQSNARTNDAWLHACEIEEAILDLIGEART